MVIVIVYTVDERVFVDVPLITHVELLIVKPEESAGELEHDVIAAPLVVRVLGVTFMSEFTKPVVPVELA